MAHLVVVPERLEHLRLLQIEPQRAHGHFELVVVHRAVLVRVSAARAVRRAKARNHRRRSSCSTRTRTWMARWTTTSSNGGEPKGKGMMALQKWDVVVLPDSAYSMINAEKRFPRNLSKVHFLEPKAAPLN